MPEREHSELCPHFGECGGCETQDVPYAEQLARKEAVLRELFGAYWDKPIPVAASPVIWHYRNRLDFHFAPKYYPEPPPKGFARETVLGFKRKGRWYWPLEIHDCRLGSEETAGLLLHVRAWRKMEGLSAFDSRTKQGFLKILLVREGKNTSQRMVVLITGEGEFDKASFVDAVLRAYPATSIYRAVYRGSADAAIGEDLERLYGTPTIDEVLRIPAGSCGRELRFRLSPFSFFQTNSAAAELLYGTIRRWVEESAPSYLYDLYGGCGSIALACADLVEQVGSVESVAGASEDGLCNARLNGVDNVAFVTQKVETYLRAVQDNGGMPPNSAVVLDPPRAGLHPKALSRLIELGPPRILYVSCKPTVLARELEEFRGRYRLEELRAVDMFPHTNHVEVVASLALV